MENPSPELKQLLKDFYLSFFPNPSQFELPSHRSNPTLYLDEYEVRFPRQVGAVSRTSSLLRYRVTDMYRDATTHARDVLREIIWSFHEWLDGEETPPKSLERWAKARPSRPHPETGIRIYLPFTVILFSIIGLCGLLALRLSVRSARPRSAPPHQEEEARYYVADPALDFERRRYSQSQQNSSLNETRQRPSPSYDQTGDAEWESRDLANPSSQSQELTGEPDDLLNQLWRSAGYGVTGKRECVHGKFYLSIFFL
jgi:hypothetical protein